MNPPTFFAHQFELEFKIFWVIPYLLKYSWLPYAVVAVYIAAIMIGQNIMDNRGKGFSLKGPLVAWNVLMASFSAFGLMRNLPLWALVYRKGIKHVLLDDG